MDSTEDRLRRLIYQQEYTTTLLYSLEEKETSVDLIKEIKTLVRESRQIYTDMLAVAEDADKEIRTLKDKLLYAREDMEILVENF